MSEVHVGKCPKCGTKIRLRVKSAEEKATEKGRVKKIIDDFGDRIDGIFRDAFKQKERP